MTLDASLQLGVPRPSRFHVSVVLPTYNESENIVKMIDSVAESLPEGTHSEIVVVDDNSPDGTADIAAEYGQKTRKVHVNVVRRKGKLGLSSAILAGVHSASGEIVVVMDSDLSHPPQTIPRMVHELKSATCDIVVASRYVKGGSITNWPFKRKVISKGATKIAKYGLGIKSVKDPMSGFFAFYKHIISGIKFDPIGYKMLLEMLVKVRGARVKEIPYTFTDRRHGASKLDSRVMLDYVRAVWRLYRYGRQNSTEKRTSVKFLSKVGRFYTVGASGLLVNILGSFLLTVLFPEIWYMHATIIAVVFSITTNFVLNKLWTFEDRDFALGKTLFQFGLFAGFSAFGALIQLSLLYFLVENNHMDRILGGVLAVAVASIGNFLLNKKWTFKEKIWG